MKPIAIDTKKLESVKKELERRKNLLINMAKNRKSNMDDLDRSNILEYFLRGKVPVRPTTRIELMKVFFTSCFTYSVLRKKLQSLIGRLPSPETMPEALSKLYDAPGFLEEQNWEPDSLRTLAKSIQACHNYNLDSNVPEPRIIRVLIDGTIKMEKRTQAGLDEFYKEVQLACDNGPEDMWKFVSKLSGNIYNVGEALLCDFLKNIGFARFVKVDHHLQKEFPMLMGTMNCRKLGKKEHFILSQHLADQIGWTPFHLDHLLYQWGRYKLSC